MSDESALGATIAGVGADLAPGAVVGEYRIERILGRGGMGVVYAAIQPVIEKKVAIKVLAMQFSSTPDLVRRFVDEARAVNRIGHENIIDIFSFGQLSDGRQYFVMEYLEGATLADRLQRNDLPVAEIPGVLAQICDALEAAHEKKIIHRDLKPENVWIGASHRGAPKVRLLDFGIAKLLDTGDRMVTDIGAVMGTPHFMSPEQCNGRGVDHRTDIYALGVIMYRLYAGRLPIRGQTVAEIIGKQITEIPSPPSTYASLPGDLDRLIMRCLDKDPGQRPQSARELGQLLVSLASATRGDSIVSSPTLAAAQVASGPISAGSAPVIAPPAVPAGLSRSTAVVVLAISAAVVGIGWLALRDSKPAGSQATPVEGPPPASAPVPPPPSTAPPAPIPAAPETPKAEPTPAASWRGKPRAPGDAKRKPDGKSRASSSGLVTDNPFE